MTSTGFPPHFGSSCDKSTPGREINHASLLLVLYNGKRVATLTGSPKVYQRDEFATFGTLAGGSAYDLGLQVLDTMCEFTQLPNDRLSFHMGNNFLFVLFFTGRELRTVLIYQGNVFMTLVYSIDFYFVGMEILNEKVVS